MNTKALKTLEYNKIITMLEERAASSLGKKMCRELLPMEGPELINRAQEETGAALTRIYRRGEMSFQGLTDISASFSRLEIDGALNAYELLRIADLLEVAKRALAYEDTCCSDMEDGAELDCLSPFFRQLEEVEELRRNIKRCILSEDEIADEASSELLRIRRRLQNVGGDIHKALTGIINSNAARTYLQDALITQRNGRYCIPVKSEYQSQIPGMVHDRSSSGSTVFIEPTSVVKLNNEVKELMLKEEEEIGRILQELSLSAAGYILSLKNNFEILTNLDFIFAKGSFAREIKATKPEFGTYMELKKARHPLINPEVVVPVDIRLGRDFKMLVITGPNTGGKTVSLKTAGLLSLMGQAGLHVPCDEGSTLCIFNDIYADIGDEQSIEMSLSTFSAHMTNIADILKKAKQGSLILFDELCSGTDPDEGAALAMSILTNLLDRGILTMVTTHYSELKVFALQTKRVTNGCCEFDVKSLRPTYRLLIGVPGKSNAFEIAGQLGISKLIIDKAKAKMDSENVAFEDLITDLNQSRTAIERDEQEIAESRREIAALKAQLKQKNENLESKRLEILEKARAEAREIIQQAKDFTDKTIKNVNKYGQGANTRALEKERAELNAKMKAENSKATDEKRKSKLLNQKGNVKASDLHIGDRVHVYSMNLDGTVSTLPDDKNELFVQMGILRSKVKITDLELLPDEDMKKYKKNYSGAGSIKMSKAMSISSEINLTGMTVDEGIAALDKYLDDALMAHISVVRVVHGKGTGALRTAVTNYLKKQTYVKSFRLGNPGEGDSGVTIVEF